MLIDYTFAALKASQECMVQALSAHRIAFQRRAASYDDPALKEAEDAALRIALAAVAAHGAAVAAHMAACGGRQC